MLFPTHCTVFHDAVDNNYSNFVDEEGRRALYEKKMKEGHEFFSKVNTK